MRAVFLVTIMLLAAPFVSGQVNRDRMSKDEKAVRQVLDEVAAALGSNDAAAIERLYTDDSVHIHTNGMIITKSQLLAGMRSGFVKFEYLRRDEVSVRLYGNAAVAISRITFKSRVNGQEMSGQYRATGILLKIKGHWRIAGGQATTIAEQK
jgi:uncharacterized protein (TIGR02246 family)